MTRRSTPAHKTDETTFAVRVRILIPETGLTCSNELRDWLSKHTEGQYAFHPAGTYPQCSYIYVNNPLIAAECIRTFDLKVHERPKETP